LTLRVIWRISALVADTEFSLKKCLLLEGLLRVDKSIYLVNLFKSGSSMLITTSRKPSKRTRSFCRSLNRVLNSEYINRGKMSMRDVLLKASDLSCSRIALIHEYQGNPSKITFYDEEGNEIISLDVNVAIPENRINIQKDQLTLKCELSELEDMGNVFKLESNSKSESNYLLIKESSNQYKAVLEFYDRHGLFTGLKIFVTDFKKGDGPS
jgi:U3 small nucleolar ribonucleoprotein protein IMP4